MPYAFDVQAQRVRVGPALNGSFLNGTVWPGRQFQRSCVYSSFFFEGLRDERRNHLRRAHGEKNVSGMVQIYTCYAPNSTFYFKEVNQFLQPKIYWFSFTMLLSNCRSSRHDAVKSKSNDFFVVQFLFGPHSFFLVKYI